MAIHITSPSVIKAAGTKPKTIEEFIGNVNSKTGNISIARMKSPEGWEEPGQRPEFNEYSLVLRGILRVMSIEGFTDVKAGEAIIVHSGEWVRYSTPHKDGAEYIAVCTPAFSAETVHRDNASDPENLSEDEIKAIAAQLRKPSGDEGLKTAAWMNEGNEALIMQVYRQLEAFPSEKVLEIGFGNGRYNEILLKVNGNSFMAGIDYSSDMVKIASKINAAHIEKGLMELKESSAENIPYDIECFDQVCSSNTVYFWGDPATVLREIRRVLKPGGILALGYRPKRGVEELPFVKYGFTLYDETEIEALLRTHGFEIMSTVTSEDGKLKNTCTCARKLH